MEYFNFHIIKWCVQRSVSASLVFCVRYVPWSGKEQVWNVKKYLHTGDLQILVWSCYNQTISTEKNPQIGFRVYHNFKVRVSTNAGKKWEIYTDKNWKPLHKWECQGTSLHHWNQYSFHLQADIPYTPKIKLGCLKLLLKIRFRLLLELVYFSKAAATDCRSLYKQCLCHIQRRKWMLTLVLCSPFTSGSDWLHLILHIFTVLPWPEIY